MNAIETFQGRYFDYDAATDPRQLNLGDIATALSNTCRYGGFCNKFYSVAEHAVLVARILREQRAGYQLVLAGLHHDSHEAYIGDAPTPLKVELGDDYRRLAAEIDWAIEAWLDLPLDHLSLEAVKEADRIALRWESYLLKDSQGIGTHWGTDSPPRDIPYWFSPGLQPAEAKRQFINWHVEFAA